jgi:Family of unknown function (DUF6152)
MITNTRASIAIGLALVLSTKILSAHHAFSAEFDDKKPVVLKGTVVKWELSNPHSWIHLEVKDAAGATAWAIVDGSLNSLLRHGFRKTNLPPRTEIIVHGFQAKDGEFRAVGTDVTFTDGRRLFMGGGAPGADGAEAPKDAK